MQKNTEKGKINIGELADYIDLHYDNYKDENKKKNLMKNISVEKSYTKDLAPPWFE